MLEIYNDPIIEKYIYIYIHILWETSVILTIFNICNSLKECKKTGLTGGMLPQSQLGKHVGAAHLLPFSWNYHGDP